MRQIKNFSHIIGLGKESSKEVLKSGLYLEVSPASFFSCTLTLYSQGIAKDCTKNFCTFTQCSRDDPVVLYNRSSLTKSSSLTKPRN